MFVWLAGTNLSSEKLKIIIKYSRDIWRVVLHKPSNLLLNALFDVQRRKMQICLVLIKTVRKYQPISHGFAHHALRRIKVFDFYFLRWEANFFFHRNKN